MSSRVHQLAATAVKTATSQTETKSRQGAKARLYEFPSSDEVRMRPGRDMGALRGAAFALLAEALAAVVLYGLWRLWHVMH